MKYVSYLYRYHQTQLQYTDTGGSAPNLLDIFGLTRTRKHVADHLHIKRASCDSTKLQPAIFTFV